MKRTIMTVDDSESIRQLIGFSLQNKDYVVLEAENGQTALNKMNQFSVDLLITDLDMPEMDGLELIRHVRADRSNTNLPIIILTTQSDGAMKEEAKSLGASGWIKKPFRPHQLLAVIDRLT